MPQPAETYTSPNPIEPLDASVYILRNGAAAPSLDARVGMGFIIGEQHVLTCAHVIESARNSTANATGQTVLFSYSALNQKSAVIAAVVEGHWPRNDDATPEDDPSDVALLRIVDKAWKGHPVGSEICPWALGVTRSHDVHGYGISNDYRTGVQFEGRVIGALAGMRLRITSHQDPDLRIVQGCSGGAVWCGDVVVGMATSFQQDAAGLFIPTRFLRSQPAIAAAWTDEGRLPVETERRGRNSLSEAEADWMARPLGERLAKLIHRCNRERILTDIDTHMGSDRSRALVGVVAARDEDIFHHLYDRVHFGFEEELFDPETEGLQAFRLPKRERRLLPWRDADETASDRLPRLKQALAQRISGADSAKEAAAQLRHGPSQLFYSEVLFDDLCGEDADLMRDWSLHWKSVCEGIPRAPAHLICVCVGPTVPPNEIRPRITALLAQADAQVATYLGLLGPITAQHVRDWIDDIAKPLAFTETGRLQSFAIDTIRPPLRMRQVEQWAATINEEDVMQMRPAP